MAVARTHLLPLAVDEHRHRVVRSLGADDERPQGIGEGVDVVGGADVAPSGGRHGDQAVGGAAVQECQRGGRGMTMTNVVGRDGITQVVPPVEVVDAGVAAAEHRVVQDRPEEVAIGLEAVDLECARSARARRPIAVCPARRHAP